jgi:hypothetical protein
LSEPLTALPLPLFTSMQSDLFLVLNTIDHETHAPSVNAISWVYANNPETIRFAIDSRSRIVLNIRQHQQVSLTYIGHGTVYAISGTAHFVTEQLEGVPFKLACVDVHISAIREAMFYGAKITNEIEYEKTYDKRAAEKLDAQVFEAMKKA